MPLTPSATYKAPQTTQEFTTSQLADTELTTNGTTTGPSSFVLSKGAVDRDAPSAHKESELGKLRARVTSLQDQINVYLTKRMEEQKQLDLQETEVEKKLLDGGDEDSD